MTGAGRTTLGRAQNALPRGRCMKPKDDPKKSTSKADAQEKETLIAVEMKERTGSFQAIPLRIDAQGGSF